MNSKWIKKVMSLFLVMGMIISISLMWSSMEAEALQCRTKYFNTNYSLCGNGATDMVAVAKAQLGKTGSQLRYSEQWCADFVSDCAILANQASAIPAAGHCTPLRKNIREAGGIYVTKAEAKPGDIVFYGPNGADHVEIVYAASNGKVSTYGGNSGSGDLYSRKVKQHATQSQSIAYIIRPNYRGGGNDCSCSSSYAGDYVVTTSNYPLTMRSGHVTGYAQVTTIPKGNVVKVTKGNSTWAHVTWNGYSGYCSMEYLKKKNTGHNPIGVIDSVTSKDNYIQVSGWAFDEDEKTQAVDVHIYVGGPAGSGAPGYSIKANQKREDVGKAYPGVGNYHGYSFRISVNKTGTIPVYVYAINRGGGTGNTYLGSKNVVVKGDNTAPTITNVKVSNISEKGYTVTCTVMDNKGVDRVQFPTWTGKNGQDDIVQNWQTSSKASGIKSGDTYTFRVNISEHNNESGTYYTHIYAYDKSGNYSATSAVGAVSVPKKNTGHNPKGVIDSVTSGNNYIQVSGWAFDEDEKIQALDIHVYVGGPAGSGAPGYSIKANQKREDVGKVYSGVGNYHGYYSRISVNKTGTIPVYIYAINKGGGTGNTLLGSRNVVVKDTIAPTITNVKVTNLSVSGYTVTCTVKDNVGVDRVQFPTWTSKNGQDDIVQNWPTKSKASGTKSGDTYTFRVDISEHNNEGGAYLTHIYAYDKQGNCSATGALGIINIPKATNEQLIYRAQVQDVGWQPTKCADMIAGTMNQSKRMESLIIWLADGSGNSMIQYRAHVQDIGWQEWKSSGQVAGTVGQMKRIEAVQIKLNDAYSKKYDIYYRVYVENVGWLGWAKNGEVAGSTGFGMRIEAIQIKLVSKGTSVSVGGSACIPKTVLRYRSHVEDYGWMEMVSNGAVSGTVGQSKRMEALYIYLKDFSGNNGILFRTHVSNEGWQEWKTGGQTSGTTGQSKAIEAVEIKLSNSFSTYFDIYYRLQVAEKGWLGWAKNGEKAGTTGGSLRAEAIQIKLVVKGSAFNRGGQAYYDMSNSSDTQTWAFPMRNAYCTWRSSINMSWANRGSNTSRPYHCGIDIASGSGDANVYAASYGKVVYTGYSSGNGNHIIIQHTLSGKTVYTLYSHLSSISCSVGNYVNCGTKIGVYGSTGNSTGNHLHFAVFTGYCTNPDGYIPSVSGNSGTYNGITFYNPIYVINNRRLP